MNFSPDSVLGVLRESPQALSKREIARALNIKGGPDRIELKQALKELERSGQIIKQPGGDYSLPLGLPSVTVIEITDIDLDGDVFAKPAEWAQDGPPPRIEVMPGKAGHQAFKPGERALAALKKRDDDFYSATILKTLHDDPRDSVIGLVAKDGNYWSLQPANKKAKYDFDIPRDDLNGAKEGDMVVGEIQPARGLRRQKVRIIEIIGAQDDPKAISLLSIHECGLRNHFPASFDTETKDMKVPDLKGRDDLRNIPLITIDGADARDFDDAVFAEPAEGGFHLIVAIADVSYYVRPDSALDREAYARGNSTYFPDRVVPMLPEILSNDLCSLRPHEPRACLAVHMWVNGSGQLTRYKFVRGLMNSHARCTYEQVQTFYETGAGLEPEFKPIIRNLYAAYDILDQARQDRGALDLDLPERQVIINETGDMTGVRTRTRLDAHKLIEEFMILANVAAAMALEAKKAPCVYRVHESPHADKVASASEFIEGFGLSLPKGQAIKPKQLNHILHLASDLPYKHLIHEVLLRTQSQARYSPDNVGHFGLALTKYAHFTSPIRRYADLLVHRSLIRAYGLGPGGLSDEEAVRLEEKAQAISDCERKSIEAERSAVDRFTAAFLSEQVGSEFTGRISGVTRFGLFIRLNDTGADGIVPIRSLGDDYFVHDEHRHALIGKRTGVLFRLGAEVNVRLKEADGLTGSTVLELVGHKKGADVPGFKEVRRGAHAKYRDDKPKRAFSKDKKPKSQSDKPKPHKSRKDHKKPKARV